MYQEVIVIKEKVKKDDIQEIKKNNKVIIKVNENVSKLLNEYAKQEGVSRAEILRRCLNFFELARWCKNNRKIYLVETDDEGKQKNVREIIFEQS